MEVFGTATATAQLLPVLGSVRDSLKRIHDAPTEVLQYKAQVRDLQESLRSLQDSQPCDDSAVKHELDSIHDIIAKILTELDRKSRRRTKYQAAISRDWDRKINKYFETLQNHLRALLTRVVAVNTMAQIATGSEITKQTALLQRIDTNIEMGIPRPRGEEKAQSRKGKEL
jgi:uncharacterized protein YlxW (UPF0749 family)